MLGFCCVGIVCGESSGKKIGRKLGLLGDCWFGGLS